MMRLWSSFEFSQYFLIHFYRSLVDIIIRLDPSFIERSGDRAATFEWATDVFRKEYSASQECENIPFTPNFWVSRAFAGYISWRVFTSNCYVKSAWVCCSKYRGSDMKWTITYQDTIPGNSWVRNSTYFQSIAHLDVMHSSTYEWSGIKLTFILTWQ